MKKKLLLMFVIMALAFTAVLGGCGQSSGGGVPIDAEEDDSDDDSKTTEAEKDDESETTEEKTTADKEETTTEATTAETTKEAEETTKTKAERTTAEKTTAEKTTADETTTEKTTADETTTGKAGTTERAGGSSAKPPSDINPVEASLDNPGKFGDWVETKIYSVESGGHSVVYYRLNEIVNGEAAQAEVDKYNETGFRKYNALEDTDLEYYVLYYDVFIPEDFPADKKSGVLSPSVRFEAESPDGGGIKFKGRSYIGLGYMDNISEDVEYGTLFPGAMWSGKSAYAMIKNFSDYEIECNYYEGDKSVSTFVLPPALEGERGDPAGAAVTKTAADPSKAVSAGPIRKASLAEIAPLATARDPEAGTSTDNPAAIGEWIEVTRNNSESGDFQPVFIRVTNVVRGEAAQATVDAYNKNERRKIPELEDTNLEYCILMYEEYFPEDYPADANGITYVNTYFSAGNPNGGGIPSKGLSYIGIGSTTDLMGSVGLNKLYPGDIWTGMSLFTMAVDYDEFVFDTYYNTNESDDLVHKYISGK